MILIDLAYACKKYYKDRQGMRLIPVITVDAHHFCQRKAKLPLLKFAAIQKKK